MMLLFLCFQAILAPENIFQRIDRHVWLVLPKFSFFVCRLQGLSIFLLFLWAFGTTQPLFVVINILDIYYANCD